MIRIAMVVSHPIQYKIGWYREIAAAPGVDLRVFFCCDWGVNGYLDPSFGRVVSWDIPMFEGYSYEYLPIAKRPERLHFAEVDNPQVSAALDRFDPDVVCVNGYGHRTMWRVARWARRRRRVLMVTSDSNVLNQPARWKQPLKRLVVGRFYSQVDGAFCIGDRNRAYHESFGLPGERLFRGAAGVDFKRMRAAVPDVDATRSAVRARCGIPDEAFTVVLSAKYIRRKRPMDLLEALVRLRDRGTTAWAILVGEGQERDALTAYMRSTGLRTGVLTGFVNQTALPEYYAAADAIALPSEYEPFGMVLAEALAFGRPLIASERVGCVDTAGHGPARPGVNAAVHRVGDVAALAGIIESLIRDRAMYARMSAASLSIADEHGAEAAATTFVAASESLRAIGPRGSRA